MGEYLVFLLALIACGAPRLAAPSSRRLRLLGAAAVGLALLLTFSFAWLGGLVVVVGCAALARPRARSARALAVALVLLALLATTWAMNVGLPASAPGAGAEGFRPCSEVDVDHQVSYVTRDVPARCSPLYISWPYAAPLTPYLDSKRRAIGQFLSHPWAGTGEGQYAAALRRSGEPNAAGLERTDYDTPHCAYLEAFATSGTGAGLALLVLAGLVFCNGMRRATGAATSDPRWLGPWLGLVALLCIGVNIDLLAQRQLWFPLGLLCASGAGGLDAKLDAERVAPAGLTH